MVLLLNSLEEEIITAPSSKHHAQRSIPGAIIPGTPSLSATLETFSIVESKHYHILQHLHEPLAQLDNMAVLDLMSTTWEPIHQKSLS